MDKYMILERGMMEADVIRYNETSKSWTVRASGLSDEDARVLADALNQKWEQGRKDFGTAAVE